MGKVNSSDQKSQVVGCNYVCMYRMKIQKVSRD